MLVQPLRSRAQQGYEYVDAPESVDHGRDRRQQLYNGSENSGYAEIEEILGQKNRNGYAEQAADDQRQQRAVEGAPDLGQNPEHLAAHVPGRTADETQAMLCDGRHRLTADLPQDVGDQEDYQNSAGVGDRSEDGIAKEVARRWRAGDGARHRRFGKGVGSHVL
jgi:hypothetical protein